MFLRYLNGMEECGQHVPDDELPLELNFPKNPIDKEVLIDYGKRQVWCYRNDLWYVMNEEDIIEWGSSDA